MKMATFENYYVNFFNETDHVFQEGKGPVERSDIENINISEIIENRDFKLLEKNLVHVRNFNFEKGYNVKGIDDNLFKLFRLAQIGLNYLMHKESCLSKCLLLLQEEVETLQRERESSKRLSNLNVQRVKNRKTRIVEPHYQCQECGKIFITESYLKCHEKRRHKNPLNVKGEEENAKRSIYTQTLFEGNFEKKESKGHLMIQKLEKELEELKNRLNATETCLKEKKKEKEPPQCSPVPQVFFPSAVVHSLFPAGPEPDPFEFPSHSLTNHHGKIIMDSPDKNEEKLTECSSKGGAGNGQRNDDKENMKPSSVSVPRPFPRRIKEKKETDFGVRSRHGTNAAKEIKNCLSPEKNRYEYSTGKRRKEVETVGETIIKETNWGFESCDEKGASGAPKSASLLKKLVKKSSPRILELKYNLKKSFTNLYEAVTSGGKENPKGNDNESEAGQSGTTETANSRQLKEMSESSKKKLLTIEPESERKMEKGIARWQGGNLKDHQEPRSLEEKAGNSGMYPHDMQIESDPESDSPSFKGNEIREKTQLTKEFDLTIFQVGKFKSNLNE